MKNILVLCTVLFSLAAMAAQSQDSGFWTGNGFTEQIKRAPAQSVFWMGFVRGVAGKISDQGLLCAPGGVTLQQELDVVAKYIKDHVDRRQNRMVDLAQVALTEAWPCSKPSATMNRPERCASLAEYAAVAHKVAPDVTKIAIKAHYQNRFGACPESVVKAAPDDGIP